ncbi:MAG: hypothetical protein IJ829_03020 [Kiritimatiellae bacterium]|nr:hypothetical protein [Kiritimatiellia bacterium]
MTRLAFTLALGVALGAARADARTVAITDTHALDGLQTSFDLAFGPGEATEGLYLAYGNYDAGDDIKAWPNLVKVADIAPETATYTCGVPDGWGTTANVLRFFTATVAELPYDARLEYIACNGANEYADTGYKPTSDTKVAVDMAFLSNSYSSEWVPIWGYRRVTNQDAFALFVKRDAKQFALNFVTTDTKADTGITYGERFVFRNDNSDMYVTRVDKGEAETLIYQGLNQTFAAQDGWTIALGGFRIGLSNVEARALKMRLYGLKIWEGDVLMRDYVPAYKNGDVGLYDNKTRTMLVVTESINAFKNGPVALANGDFDSFSSTAAAVFAPGAPFAGEAVRSVSVAATNRVAGVVSSYSLRFTPCAATNYLYMASGAADGGDDPSDWDRLDFVRVVRPFDLDATVAVPDGWGDGVAALRFFLGAPPAKPYDRDLEYIASTGSQCIDTGVKLNFGQTFSLVWRQYATASLYDNDAGWGAGYGASKNYAIIGGGLRRGSSICLWLFGTQYNFTPGFAAGSLTTAAVYRDECTVADTISYTMTDTATGESWALASSVAPTDGSSYVSNARLYLGRSGADTSWANPGKKAFYRATLADSATGAKVFDLVPVEKDGEACMYDLVSGNIFGNAGKGGLFIPGPEAAPRLDSTAFVAASETVSLLGQIRVVAGAVAQKTHTTATIGFDVRALGAAAAVDVDVLYGPSPDALTRTARLASAVGLGAGSGDLGSLAPGRVYYARLVASANGEESEPSALVTIELTPPDSPAAGDLRPITSASAVGSLARATFDSYASATPLYAAYGAEYGGETTNGWEHVVKVGDVAADATSASFALPAGWGADIRFLRYFFWCGLPEGVTLLDSLSATGTQHIDTGLYPHRDMTVEVCSKVASGAASDWVPLLGERRTSNYQFNMVLWMPKSPATTNVRPNLGEQQYDILDVALPSGTAAGDVNTYALSIADGLVVNGTTIAAPGRFVDTTKVATDTLLLFGLKDDGAVNARKFVGTCYFFKAYDGSALVLNLMPCRDGEGEVAMCDTLTGEIYRNAGSGSFGAGSEVEGGFRSFSEVVVAADASSPVLGATSVSGEWQGDCFTVSGSLEGAGAGACTITVETSRTGDFSDAVAWPLDGTFAAGDDFSVELYSSDVSAPGYLAPGSTVWYRVKATDREGSLDASVASSVALPGAYVVGTPTASSVGKSFTVTAPITARGANTLWAWVEYGMDVSSIDRRTALVEIPQGDASSVVVSGVAPASGTLYWSLVVSNDCSTAVWTSATDAKSRALSNNVRYTWKKSVPEGNWEDAASWDAPEGRFDYPTADSEAYFLDNTTAKVTVASSLASVKTLYMYERNIEVTVTGGRDHKLLANNFAANATGGTLCFSNLEFEVTQGGFAVNAGRTIVFYDVRANFYNGATLDANGGPDRHIVIAGGSHIHTSCDFRVGGAGSTITVDDSRAEVYGQGKGFFFSSYANGGEIIVKGRNARLEAASYFRCSMGYKVGGRLTFVIPEGGFAATPVVQIPYGTGTVYDESRWFFANALASAADPCPNEIYVDPASPGLKGGSLTTPLVAWKTGLSLGNMIFLPLAKPTANGYLYSPAFDSTDDLVETWDDAGSMPKTLVFSRKAKGFMLIVR